MSPQWRMTSLTTKELIRRKYNFVFLKKISKDKSYSKKKQDENSSQRIYNFVIFKISIDKIYSKKKQDENSSPRCWHPIFVNFLWIFVAVCMTLVGLQHPTSTDFRSLVVRVLSTTLVANLCYQILLFNVKICLQTGGQHQMKQTCLLCNTFSFLSASQHWKFNSEIWLWLLTLPFSARTI